MLEKVVINSLCKSASGAIFFVSSLGRHAQSCETVMVIYQNLTPTSDFPVGQTWVLDKSIFCRRMSPLSMIEFEQIKSGNLVLPINGFDPVDLMLRVNSLHIVGN